MISLLFCMITGEKHKLFNYEAVTGPLPSSLAAFLWLKDRISNARASLDLFHFIHVRRRTKLLFDSQTQLVAYLKKPFCVALP